MEFVDSVLSEESMEKLRLQRAKRQWIDGIRTTGSTLLENLLRTPNTCKVVAEQVNSKQ